MECVQKKSNVSNKKHPNGIINRWNTCNLILITVALWFHFIWVFLKLIPPKDGKMLNLDQMSKQFDADRKIKERGEYWKIRSWYGAGLNKRSSNQVVNQARWHMPQDRKNVIWHFDCTFDRHLNRDVFLELWVLTTSLAHSSKQDCSKSYVLF